MLGSRDAINSGDKGPPGIALIVQDLPAGLGDPIKAPAALIGLLDPASPDPSVGFQAIEQGIERCGVESQLAARTDIDQFADLVAVACAAFEERQD